MGFFSFVMNGKHMLMMSLSVEFIMLSLLFLMFMYFLNLMNDYFFLMLFLSFSVCESVLCLSSLLSSIRSHWSDYFNLLNLLR